MNSFLGRHVGAPAFFIPFFACFIVAGLYLWKVPIAVADIHLTIDEKQWLDANQNQLILWFDAYSPPIEFLSEKYSFQGLSADIMTAMEKRLDISFIKKTAPNRPGQLKALKSGNIHISPAVVWSQEPAGYAFFSKPYVSIPLVIITQKNKKNPERLENLAGRRVAVVKGSVSEKYIRNEFHSQFKIIRVSNIREGLRDTAFGVVDAFVGDLAAAAYYIDNENLPNLRVAGYIGYEHRLSFAVNKKYPLLFSLMQKALDDVPPEEIRNIRDKWISLENREILSKKEKQFLQFALSVTLFLLLIVIFTAWYLKNNLKKKENALQAAESAVKNQEERLDLAMKATQAAIWDLHPMTGKVVFSDQWFINLGYDPKDVEPSFEGWTGLIHPDDLPGTTKTLNHYLDKGGAGYYEAQFRMRDKQGQWRWILVKGQAVEWDEQGQVIRMIGLNIDIHRQKRAEEALRESEAISTALFNQAFNYFGLLDKDGRILRVNDSALKGLKVKKDVSGRSFWEAPWWLDRNEARRLGEEAMNTAKRGEVYHKEVRHITGEGEIRYTDFALSPLKDSKGRVIYLIPEGSDITRYKHALKQMEESEQRFKSIFDNAPYAIVISSFEDGRFLEVNNAFLKARELTKAQALQTEPEGIIGKVSPEEQARIIEKISRGGVFNLERHLKRLDGSAACVLYSAVPIPYGDREAILSMVVDITDKKKAEEALRDSEKKFSELFMLSPDSIVLFDLKSQKIIEVNESFLKIFGYERKEVLGKTTQELSLYVRPSDREMLYKQIHKEEKTKNIEIACYRSDGEVTVQLISGREVMIGGKQVLLMIGRDVTELKRIEEMMVQTEKMVSLGGIAAGIAHEINNPLGIVFQAAQNLQLRSRSDFPKNLEAAEEIGLDMDLMAKYMHLRKMDVFIEDIKSAAVRAADIIKRMLLFSRKNESQRTVCHLPAIVEHALSLAKNDFDLKKTYDFKKISVNVHIEKDVPEINCTETEIEQVLLNLLRNAAQAMAEIAAPEHKPAINIRISTHESTVRIEIQDNGPGIPDHIKKRVMEPFFTTKGPGTGTGLGLSVSYFIITRGHGGQFTVSSQPGKGTRFTIYLPCE